MPEPRSERPASPSNHNWVCFACRTAIRQSWVSRRIPKCLACGQACFWLGAKVAVPRKRDAAGWQKLFRDCVTRKLRMEEEVAQRKVRIVHAAEQRIRSFRAQAPNRDRQKLIVGLEERIARLRGGGRLLPYED